MGKEGEGCRLEQCGLSDCVRRLPSVEGSLARSRVGAHWALKNLIIEKIHVAVKMTLDGAGEIHDVMPAQFFGNETKIMALKRENLANTVRMIHNQNCHLVGQVNPEKCVMNSSMTS